MAEAMRSTCTVACTRDSISKQQILINQGFQSCNPDWVQPVSFATLYYRPIVPSGQVNKAGPHATPQQGTEQSNYIIGNQITTRVCEDRNAFHAPVTQCRTPLFSHASARRILRQMETCNLLVNGHPILFAVLDRSMLWSLENQFNSTLSTQVAVSTYS